METYSTTVRISYPDGQCPETFEQAMAELSAFGEIARLDTSLSGVLGCILVTFFDVRCAQALTMQFPDRTEQFPQAAHDSRTVRVSMATFAENMGTIGGFHAYGEVASVSIAGEDAVIEFFDVRAAQRLLTTVSNCNLTGLPLPMMPPRAAVPPNMAVPPAALFPGATTGLCANKLSPSAFHAALFPLAKAALLAEEGVYEEPLGEQHSANGKAANKPLRTKVSNKEFSKFEIDVDKIQNGKDLRTTVMVRNLSSPNARADFEKVLEACGLDQKYTFFYMPFKEHRNVYAGFAFVNFQSPTDVLALYMALTKNTWKQIVGEESNTKVPAMSYARFQGHEELMSHFSSSAVLHDHDPTKRPLFRTASKAANEAQDGTGGTSTPKSNDNPQKAPITFQVNSKTDNIKKVPQSPAYVPLPTESPELKEKGGRSPLLKGIPESEEVEDICAGA